MSWLSSSRWVAKECRRVWHVASLAIPAPRTASFTARWRTDSWRWWRRRWPVRPSIYRRVAGKIHCHPQSRPAFGYLRGSAPGSSTQPAPCRTSAWCCSRTRSMWALSTDLTEAGSIVTRSLCPLPSRIRIWFGRGTPIKSLEDGANLVARQHGGQVLGPLGSDDVVEPRQLDTEYLAVQEQQRV